ncbi:hypothetical protein [Pseudoalteromonas sp. M8]|uniref:hypothetical protein n=1 Tax=Pseudoalteromonas sp. M8 TaxID=2692624 RepID=UPI001BA7BB67|nr:hypothetical protein [Pseudoalteromonas sp. M8]QUI71240.1 hypothetical protein GSF13_16445 [Pseudoalteromonas sp. M8]
MVKQAIKRLILRYFPELGERKHLPQLAKFVAIYDLPTDTPKASTPYRPYKAADIQLINPQTLEPTDAPVFQQVTLAIGQPNNAGVISHPKPGMLCLLQYIDGLNSLPVITAILPWQSLVPSSKHTDVSLLQSATSSIQGRDESWHMKTDRDISQCSDTSTVMARSRNEAYHERTCNIESHDITRIDGNQINEVMGALKTIVGEKALLTALEGVLIGSKKQIEIKAHDDMQLQSLRTLYAKAADLAKVEGATVWVGNNSVNAIRIILELIEVVAKTNEKIATHKHEMTKPPPINAAEFTGFKSKADALHGKLNPITK